MTSPKISTVPLTVCDGNNWFRRRVESITVGTPIRNCFYEIQNKPGVVIVVWDGFGGLKPRRAIYPEYKMTRRPAGESIYEAQDLLKKVLNFSKAFQFQVNGYEGDDVIAHLVKRYEDQFSSITIESNDLDLYQLGKPMSRDKFPDQPRNIRLYKTMVGDPSDNISGCRGFGKGGWQKLTEEHKRLIEGLILNPVNKDPAEVKHRLEGILPARALNWFAENLDTLRVYYSIVGFIEVPSSLVDQSNSPGLNRPDLAEPIFKEYML